MNPSYKIAIVHDWLNQVGGAENVLEEMVTLFPEADVYTSIFAPEKMPPTFQSWPIRTSFMQALPFVTSRHQHYMPIYPLAFQRFHLESYDLVLSNKSGFCHGVRTKKGYRLNSQPTADKETSDHEAIHVCYCLTPTRFLWSLDHYLSRERFGLAQTLLLRPLLPLLRRWDQNAAKRVDHFVAISREIQQRIQRIYARESTIIYPPVDTNYFTPCKGGCAQTKEEATCQLGLNIAEEVGLPAEVAAQGYYLIVSRLIPYKRIDLAVRAFAQLPNQQLVVVGDGRDHEALEGMASDNVHFLGHLSRDQVRELLRHCTAFIFPGLEDFGIAPVEAMSVGRPVIAFAGGGALDTVLPGVSGELFQEQTVPSLLNTLENFQPNIYTADGCRHQAEKFSVEKFQFNLQGFIEQVIHDKEARESLKR